MCIGMQKPWYVGLSASTVRVDMSRVIHEGHRGAEGAVENCHVVLSSWVMADTSSNMTLSDWIRPVILSTACMTVV